MSNDISRGWAWCGGWSSRGPRYARRGAPLHILCRAEPVQMTDEQKPEQHFTIDHPRDSASSTPLPQKSSHTLGFSGGEIAEPPQNNFKIAATHQTCSGLAVFAVPHCTLASSGSIYPAALGALGVQSSASHPGPGSSEAHPAGRMIGIGLRAREP